MGSMGFPSGFPLGVFTGACMGYLWGHKAANLIFKIVLKESF